MAKLRMAHASTHGARKPPGPTTNCIALFIFRLLSVAVTSCLMFTVLIEHLNYLKQEVKVGGDCWCDSECPFDASVAPVCLFVCLFKFWPGSTAPQSRMIAVFVCLL